MVRRFLLLSYQLPRFAWAACVSMATVPILSSPWLCCPNGLYPPRALTHSCLPASLPASLPHGPVRLSVCVHVAVQPLTVPCWWKQLLACRYGGSQWTDKDSWYNRLQIGSCCAATHVTSIQKCQDNIIYTLTHTHIHKSYKVHGGG